MESLAQYELLNELGRGGMGRVVLARDRELGRLVALKFRQASSGDTLAQNRFRREARALAALNDPGIVQIFAIGCEEETEYIAMEFVEGCTLRSAVRSGALAPQELLAKMAEIADSMASAHNAGILHRDLKPDNIMLADGGQIKIVDFGLARRLDEVLVEGARSSMSMDAVFAETVPLALSNPLTTQSSVMGTPHYMAQELLHAREATPAADVYALGVTLYELLAGSAPINGDNVAEIIGRIVDPAYQPATLADVADVDPSISELVQSMMAWEPDDRPSMAAVRDRLRHAEEPVAASSFLSAQKGKGRALAALLGTAAAIAFVCAWQLARIQTRVRAAPSLATAPLARTALAIAPVSLRHDAAQLEDSNALADLFAMALRGGAIDVSGPRRLLDQIAPASASDPAWEAAAERLGASLLLRSVIETEADGYRLRAELRNLEGQLLRQFEIQASLGALDTLVVALAKEVSAELGSELAQVRAPAVDDIDELGDYELALQEMFAGRWTKAASALERTVAAHPSFGAAWYQLALARSWGGLPAAEAAEAASRAQSLSQDPRERELMRGLGLYLAGDFRASLALLRPLQAQHPRDRDILYHLAEAVYHNGEHAEGVALFEQLLRDSPRFAMAAWHPFQRSLVDRDELAARRYRAILRPRASGAKEDLDLAFALGEYETLSQSGPRRYRIQSLAVLGQEGPLAQLFGAPAQGALEMVEKIAWHHRAREPRQRDEVFKAYMGLMQSGDSEASNEFVQRQLGEVLITAGLASHTQELLEAWQPSLRSSEVYRSLAIHWAALVRHPLDPALYERNSGHARAAGAARFERLGKSEQAARLWKASIADPHHYYMYMERAALLRNLRGDDYVEACRALQEPAVYRPALLVSPCLALNQREASLALQN